MVKSYELNVDTKDFQNFVKSQKYLITENQDYQVGDFILLKETAILKTKKADVEASAEDTYAVMPTDRYCMTCIEDVIQSDGLKEGYVLLIIREL